MYVLGAIVVIGCCDFHHLEIDLFYDLTCLGIYTDVFVCALPSYSVNTRICMVYDKIFRSGTEKCNMVHDKANENKNNIFIYINTWFYLLCIALKYLSSKNQAVVQYLLVWF
jgi:hypothetical protein